jgi:hypothetical protein
MAISNNSTGLRPGVCTSSTRPTAPYNGQVIYETDSKQTLVYNGTAWVMLTDADTPPGLELIKTQTVGSAVSSVTVSDAFSSTYENYKITMNSVGSTNHSTALSLGSSVTGYNGILFYSDSTVGTASIATRNNNSQMNWIGGCAGNGFSATASFDLLGPFSSNYTKVINGQYQDGVAYGIMQGEHRVAASYTSFTLAPNSGTITGGIIRVYGYRNS